MNVYMDATTELLLWSTDTWWLTLPAHCTVNVFPMFRYSGPVWGTATELLLWSIDTC